MLVVEQSAQLALAIAGRAYVLESGAIAVEGSAEQLRNDDSIKRAYLGIEVDEDAADAPTVITPATTPTVTTPTVTTPATTTPPGVTDTDTSPTDQTGANH